MAIVICIVAIRLGTVHKIHVSFCPRSSFMAILTDTNIQKAGADNWHKALSFDTLRLSVMPCDAQADRDLAVVAANPRVFTPYFVGRPGSSPVSAWTQSEHDWDIHARLNLAVRLRNGGPVIGLVQFTPVQLAYFVHPDYWQAGYGTEMIRAACCHIPGVLNIQVLDAYVIRENIASRLILEKCDFVFKGLALRKWAEGNGAVTMLHFRRSA